jgi:hypothetical protein
MEIYVVFTYSLNPQKQVILFLYEPINKNINYLDCSYLLVIFSTNQLSYAQMYIHNIKYNTLFLG